MADYITVVSAPQGNKRYSYDTKSKKIVSDSPIWHEARACTTEIDSHQTLIKLLKQVSKDETMFIILGYPKDIRTKVGLDNDYFLWSQSIMTKNGGHLSGWHKVKDGTCDWSICRNKSNFVHSSWILLDYDLYPDTPKGLILDHKSWVRLMSVKDLLVDVPVTISSSNSCTVLDKDGNPYKVNNFHAFVQVDKPGDIDRFSNAMYFKLLRNGTCYQHHNDNGGKSWKTIFDKSGLGRERCVYKGKPIVEKPLSLCQAKHKTVILGSRGGVKLFVQKGDAKVARMDTKRIKLKIGQTVKNMTYKGQRGAHNLICHNTLTRDINIDTKQHGWMSVQEYMESDHGHLRCQSPFRQSKTWAAFIDRHANGEAFLYDSGDEVKYLVADLSIETDKIVSPSGLDIKFQADRNAPVINGKAASGSVLDLSVKEKNIQGRYELDYPPGLLGNMCREINEMAPHPNKDIAIVSAIGIVAGICGRAYNVNGTGLNMYIALLGQSGIGKNVIKDAAARVFRSNVSKPIWMTYLGMQRFTGPKAVFNMLQCGLSRLCVLEESGLISESKAGDQAGLLRVFLDLYTNSGVGQWAGGEGYSDRKGDISLIPNPALSLVHVSTPHIFIRGLKSKKSEQSGELARMWSIRSLKPKAYLNTKMRSKYGKAVRNRLNLLMELCSPNQLPMAADSGTAAALANAVVSNSDEVDTSMTTSGTTMSVIVPEFVIQDNAQWVDKENTYVASGDFFNATLCSRAWMKSVKISSIISVFNYGITELDVDGNRVPSSAKLKQVEITREAYTWALDAVKKEIVHLQDSFSHDSTDDLLQIVKSIIIPALVRSYTGVFKDIRKCTPPAMAKQNLFSLGALNKILQNNMTIKQIDDDPERSSAPRKGLEKVVDYMLRVGLVVNADPGKVRMLGHKRLAAGHCYQMTNDMKLLLEYGEGE